ncbi:hypothetical protein C8F01DRAFT_1186318 [Mycena amicta]|nr:hypothetical protein C8F01DRAFT_1186318 [Mycena amicta]
MARTKQTMRFSVSLAPRKHLECPINHSKASPDRPLRRLARRAGVKRASHMMYDDSRAMLKVFLKKVIEDAALYAGHGYRTTVTQLDVQYALKRNSIMFYT